MYFCKNNFAKKQLKEFKLNKKTEFLLLGEKTTTSYLNGDRLYFPEE
jgi:hypothetical protein